MSEEVLSFEDLSTVQIRESIERYVREMKQLEAEKKDYNTGVKDVLKDIKTRINAALEELDKRGAKQG